MSDDWKGEHLIRARSAEIATASRVRGPDGQVDQAALARAIRVLAANGLPITMISTRLNVGATRISDLATQMQITVRDGRYRTIRLQGRSEPSGQRQ